MNTEGSENLYKLIGSLLNIDEKTVFLDICSGIGTIGMCLAENVHKVIGIEMVSDAVEDSKKNAELNNITNY